MSWLTDLVDQHKELEAPLSFWYWSALASVSAVLKDNVWFHKQLYNVYPNIYVLLHADSGLKKGPPISMANQLVSAVNGTTVISGRSSIQGILKKLGGGESTPGGGVKRNATAFICLSELTSSLVSDPFAFDIMTDLYDRNYRHTDYESLLKGEQFMIKKPTVTALMGTNPAHGESFFDKKEMNGGFFARTFIIHETQRNKTNSLMFELEKKIDYKESAEYLRSLSTLTGPLSMDMETRQFVDNWYHDLKNTIDTQKINDPTGTLNRFDDSMLKVAMLISLATQPELIITRAAVEEAMAKCEMLIGNVRQATLGQGKSTWAQEKALVIEELLRRDNHAITRQMLNKKYGMRALSHEWDTIIDSMVAAGLVSIELPNGITTYVMPDKVVKEFQNHLKGK